ncbi:MAG TPA: bifunctional RNase H/acid phosphatase [Jatrophihabitantaceae bacterium]|nr:bifunctional RNase H/acid phosphatase [Jatrophihabitantaceae bacterium]
MNVIVEADGGSRGNPGPAGYGAVVFDAATGEVLAERRESLGRTTNNVAEYRGLIAGLQAAAELGATSVAVRMDSKLVVEQMSGRWQVKHEGLRPLAREAAALRDRFDAITFEWIPRERNKHADRLANEAMDLAAGKPPLASRPVIDAPAVPSWTPPTGTPTRFVLVRHAATEHSVLRRFSGRNDLPLSDIGERQAAALARRASTFGEVAAVVSSPLRRATQSAELIADTLALGVSANDGFIESDFGAWEGLTLDEVQQRWPQELSAWISSADAGPPNGESFAAVARRVRRARDELIAKHPGATVVVVSHVTPIKTLLRLALDAPVSAMSRMFLDPASVSIVNYYPDGTPSVRLVNDTSHLDG